jgi:hypothetical protein
MGRSASRAILGLARRGGAQSREQRGHQQGRRHGQKTVHPQVEHGESGATRLHHGERTGGGEFGLPIPEHGPRSYANQAILDLHLWAEQAVVGQARLSQEASQILGLERHPQLAQPEAMISEPGHSP